MKVEYIKNIAGEFIYNVKKYNNIDEKNDQEIIDLLSKIKGIGIWTAQMFLMFTLNRPDIFPVTDLGIQKGYQKYYKMAELPQPIEMLTQSEKWSPHRTTVSLYLWRYLEGPFEW